MKEIEELVELKAGGHLGGGGQGGQEGLSWLETSLGVN